MIKRLIVSCLIVLRANGGVKLIENKYIIELFENIHILRRLAIRRITEKSPLHFGQVAIMQTIECNENCTQADVAEMLGVTPASVATSTKRLQKAGLVTKTVDSENLRCKRLALTDKGREAIIHHMSFFDDYDKLVFEDFSEEEKERLAGYLNRISKKMRELEGVDVNFSNPIEASYFLRKKMGEIISDEENNQ